MQSLRLMILSWPMLPSKFTFFWHRSSDQLRRCALQANSVQFPVDTINAAHGSHVTMVVNVTYVLGMQFWLPGLYSPDIWTIQSGSVSNDLVKTQLWPSSSKSRILS
jgi:hypothetical protein